jgi:hypothetical protein
MNNAQTNEPSLTTDLIECDENYFHQSPDRSSAATGSGQFDGTTNGSAPKGHAQRHDTVCGQEV